MANPEDGPLHHFKGAPSRDIDPNGLKFIYSWVDEEGGHQEEPLTLGQAMTRYVALKETLEAVCQVYGWTLEQIEEHVRSQL
jgi:hypothetical protein